MLLNNKKTLVQNNFFSKNYLRLIEVLRLTLKKKLQINSNFSVHETVQQNFHGRIILFMLTLTITFYLRSVIRIRSFTANTVKKRNTISLY